uniref:carboxypeptidase D n=1 Tax=Oryza brachyantha TaxID=4533 RepID=J3N884_ORYBR
MAGHGGLLEDTWTQRWEASMEDALEPAVVAEGCATVGSTGGGGVESMGTVPDWTRCKFDIDYEKDISTIGTLEYHSRLMRQGYRAIIFSGDHDARVPFTGTHAWIRFLNLSIIDSWRPWYVDGQVAGFTSSYASNNLTFATVKGAGHTSPEYKPKECVEMFRRWISGSPL